MTCNVLLNLTLKTSAWNRIVYILFIEQIPSLEFYKHFHVIGSDDSHSQFSPSLQFYYLYLNYICRLSLPKTMTLYGFLEKRIHLANEKVELFLLNFLWMFRVKANFLAQTWVVRAQFTLYARLEKARTFEVHVSCAGFYLLFLDVRGGRGRYKISWTHFTNRSRCLIFSL